MKKVLLLMVAALMVSSVAMADHIGVYSDNTGSSCSIAPGFSSTTAVIHKFALGTTGVRFKVTVPGTFFAFQTSYAPNGNLTTDLSVGYGQCLNGSIVIGNIVASLVAGTMDVLPADLQAVIQYTDCSFNELQASGGTAYVGGTGDCHEVATEQSTWGKVKSLYR